jgi:acetyl esterase/lipase
MRQTIVRASLFSMLVLLSNAASMRGQMTLRDGAELRLWTGAAPGAVGTSDADIPIITVFLPRTMGPNTPAVLVCPGGAYQHLADNHEGRQVANYFNSLGVAAFVLRYRLGPTYHHPIELGDAQRAIRMLRSHAGDWQLDPARIGIIGFSAGGHLAMTVSTRGDNGSPSAPDPIDRAGSRVNFAVLGYPVISMTESYMHRGSRDNLLGANPDPELVRSLSGENSVTKDTPPTFIFQTNEDKTVPAENSVYYFLALRKAGVPAEMHVFEKGPHGVGLANDDPALSEWSKLMTNWLRVHGVIKSIGS